MDAPLKPGLVEQLMALQAEQSEKREVRSRRNSSAGPDLPLRFSQGSIASTRHSIDPFSVEELASTLTSPEFRQRVDKDRSFQAEDFLCLMSPLYNKERAKYLERKEERRLDLCGNQPLVWGVPTKLQNSLSRSNRSRFG